MLFLIALAIALCVAFFGGSQLKKHPSVFYAAAAVITVTVIVISRSMTDGDLDINNKFINDYVINIFAKGALAGAFWCVVMWAGALPNGSRAIKKLMPIRGELSIMAGVISMAHVITYAFNYLRDLFKGRTGFDSTALTIIFNFAAITMLLIMIPLTVMSFKKIRKKMDPKRWKQIQRAAYPFYAFLYIHIIVLYAPKSRNGFDGYFESILVYTAVFGGYAAFRIRKYILKKRPDANKNVSAVICAVITLLLTGAAALIFRDRSGGEPEMGKVRERKTPAAVTTASTASESTTAASSQTTTAAASTEEASETTETSTAEASSESTTEASSEPETEENSDTSETTEAVKTTAPAETAAAPPETTAPPQTEPAPALKYKNGTYSASAYGYDGEVTVTITIENDKITSISASSDESDTDYFNMAKNPVINEILEAQDTYVHSVSGATYSSEAIMVAVETAMASALN